MNNQSSSNQNEKKSYFNPNLTPLLELYIKDKDNFYNLAKEKNINIEINEEIVKNQLVSIAARENLVNTIKLLVEKNCDPCYKNNLPLVLACQHGNIEAVNYLLSIPEVTLCPDSLLAAAQNNHVKTFALLLNKYKQDTKIKDFYKNIELTQTENKDEHAECFGNCLKAAAKFGNLMIVESIINNLNINLSEECLSDALMLATKYGTKINNINYEIKDNDLPIYGNREYFATIKLITDNISNAELIEKSIKFAELQASSYTTMQEYIKNNQSEFDKYTQLNNKNLVDRITKIKAKIKDLETNLKLLLRKPETQNDNMLALIYSARGSMIEEVNLLNIHLSILETSLDKKNNTTNSLNNNSYEEIYGIFLYLLKAKNKKMTKDDREKVNLELQEFSKAYSQPSSNVDMHKLK